MMGKSKKKVNPLFEAYADSYFKNSREIAIERVITMLGQWDPRDALEFICSFPELFEISKPVQEGGKFTYTIRIRDAV